MSYHEIPDIGSQIKAMRKQRKLTLDALSKGSGVSKSMLSQIERGQTNPTFATLWGLTRALGVNIGDLLDAESAQADNAGEIQHILAHDIPELHSRDGLCTLRILSPADTASRMEWYELSFQAQGHLESEPHASGTMEHLTVLSGSLSVESGHHSAELKAGETVRYPADVNHAIRNTNKQAAKALLVVLADPHSLS